MVPEDVGFVLDQGSVVSELSVVLSEDGDVVVAEVPPDGVGVDDVLLIASSVVVELPEVVDVASVLEEVADGVGVVDDSVECGEGEG